MRKRWSRVIFSSRSLVALLIIAQAVFLFANIIFYSEYSRFINIALTLLSLIVVIHLNVSGNISAYKLPWTMLLLIFPILGGFLYLLVNFQHASWKFNKQIISIRDESQELYLLPGNILDKALKDIPECRPQIKYLQETNGFPIYTNTETEYLSPAEVKWHRLLEELKKAEKYIFLEYFIIDEGVMWSSILNILKEKAAEGVDVRVIYDEMGCLFYLKENYSHELSKYGIKCAVFNPFRPFLTAKQNNRDHRKIAVIDGKVAFTGGINLADHYINIYEHLRYWKDASVLMRGEAAWSFALMFLQMWALTTGEKIDYESFYPWADTPCPIKSDGYVLPYCDSPMDDERVGKNVYVQMINNAKDYVYIMTPYLIIDDSITDALSLAAKSGVDVGIVVPHQSDSFLVHMTTRSYYRELIQAGVKIYEYTEGIIHAKTFISDDKVAIIGTTNLDFRSLYLHFECGAWMYGTKAVSDLKHDFITVLKSCESITEEHCKTNLIMRIFQNFLRLFAPLM